MLQACVDHFFDPMQFGAPRILSVIEPLIHRVEASINVSPQIAKARIKIAQPRVVNKNPHEYGGNSNGKGDLHCLIGHRCYQNTP
jgi:hypothetical protein